MLVLGLVPKTVDLGSGSPVLASHCVLGAFSVHGGQNALLWRVQGQLRQCILEHMLGPLPRDFSFPIPFVYQTASWLI